MGAALSLKKQMLAAATRRLTPIVAHIDVTYRCNFRCTHCYIPEHGGPELTTQQIFAVLDDLARAGTLFVVFSGGEVFLRRDLFELLAYARRLGFHVRLFTDGYFVDEKNADRLAALYLGEVHVSIYSTNARTFDNITRVPGSHARVMRAIRLMRERDIKVKLKMPILKEAAGDALSVQLFANELGCAVSYDSSIIPQRDGCADPMVAHTLDDATMRAVLGDLLDARNEVIEPFVPGTKDELPLCGAGRSTVHVEPSGQVNPCVVLPRAAGNVHERSLADIWRDSPVLHEIRGYKQKDRQGCRGCMNHGFCSFCMGRAYLSTGDSLAPAAVLCNQTKAKAEIYRAGSLEERQAALLALADADTPWDRHEAGHAAAEADATAGEGALVQIGSLRSGLTVDRGSVADPRASRDLLEPSIDTLASLEDVTDATPLPSAAA